MYIHFRVSTIILCLCTSMAYAQMEYYQKHAIGWHWYDDPLPIEKHKEASDQLSDPLEKMSTVKKTIQRALDRAILEPSVDNIKSYIQLQNYLSQQAANFSLNWQKALLEDPRLDFSLSHPTDGTALQIYHEQQSEAETIAIKDLSVHTGLFFFYKSQCGYCKKFSPILKKFADANHLSVLAISLDGVSLPEFPNTVRDEGQTKSFEVTSTPALFAVNPTSKKVFPLTYGLISESELRIRILALTQNKAWMSP